MGDQTALEQARSLRQRGGFLAAGDHFTVAAYDDLARTTPHATWYACGVVNFQRAALCYRVADRMDRCENRCRQGILVAEDMAERVFAANPDTDWERARRAIWYEFVGDFRTIASLENADSAYDRAREVYRENGDPSTAYAEEEHGPSFTFFRSVVGAVGEDPGPLDRPEANCTFSALVERKRTELPEAIEELARRREWHPPDL